MFLVMTIRFVETAFVIARIFTKKCAMVQYNLEIFLVIFSDFLKKVIDFHEIVL